MAKTIRNPVEWSADQVKGASHYLEAVSGRLTGEAGATSGGVPRIRDIEIADLKGALRQGIVDFAACRTDVAFLCILYPVIGVCLTWFALDLDLLPLLFPLMSGFAIVGPIAAIGMYEMSRRREKGEQTHWSHVFQVMSSPSFGAIFVLGLFLAALFAAWLLVAMTIYNLTVGPKPPSSIAAFASDALTTDAGWAMILLGIPAGFVFAAIALAVSVVSFPLLLDRNVGIFVAVQTSIRATMRNLRAMAVWGAVVAGALAIGSLPLFLGLILVMPVLGHATWHLYRRLIVPEGGIT